MKTLKSKTFLLSLLLMASFSFAKADETIRSMLLANSNEYAHDSFIAAKKQIYTDEKLDKESVQYTVNAYIAKIQLGYYSKELKNIYADNVKFNINRNGNIITHGKAEELAFMKANQGVKMQCKVTSNMIFSSDSYCLVKVSSKFSNFVREDLVTLYKINKSWQITEVTSVFS